MSIWISVVVLAIIQGLTEFLPVSSSGHLAVISALTRLKQDEGLAFAVVLHAGSLLAIVAFYFKTLLGFLKKDRLHLLGMVIVGSIPAGIAGVLLKVSGYDEKIFGDLLSIGMAFLVTGSLLRLTGKPKMVKNAVTPLEKISLRQSLIVGFTQMGAIFPGISRSGSTIAVGTLCGIEFEAAATFSFLLALPAIAGATLLELLKLIKSGFTLGQITPLQIGAGFLISAVVSFGALTMLVAVVKRRKLSVFAWYLFAVGLAVVGWQMLKLK